MPGEVLVVQPGTKGSQIRYRVRVRQGRRSLSVNIGSNSP
jgi:hypothetical protein